MGVEYDKHYRQDTMTPTVRIEPLDDYPAYAMIWQEQANRDDIDAAVSKLIELMKAADEPQVVVIDLRLATDFLLGKTIASVLVSVYEHSKLKELLLCGPDDVTRTLKRTLDLRTGLSKSRCFETWAEVLRYLDEMAD
jgi:anti-anti-sigma regulatory factor